MNKLLVKEVPLKQVQLLYTQMLMDTCDEDTEIRKLARQVLTEEQVEGNSYGVPTLADVVERLVEKIKRLEK